MKNLRYIALLLSLCCSIVNGKQNVQSYWNNVQSSLSKASDTFVGAVEYVEEILIGESCPFVPSPADAVRSTLEASLIAQPMAIKALVDHITAWYATDKPLVLAFTGPTGVGKTESANLVAEAILKKKIRMGKRGTRKIPKGLIQFEGGDYTDVTMVKEYKQQIINELAKTLDTCGNRAVVLFDEIQKVAPGTLDVLLEAMSERPRLTRYNYKTHESEHYDTSKVIFLLISDVGGDRMFEMVQAKNGRKNLSKGTVQREIGKIMRSQWDRLKFTQKIDGTVPFLPLEEEHVRQVLEYKLQKVRDQGIVKKKWKNIEWTNEFLEYMTTIHHNQYGIVYKRYLPEGSAVVKPRVFAKYGARNIIQSDGPLAPIQTKLHEVRKSSTSKNVIIQLDVVENEKKKGEKMVRVDVCQERNECKAKDKDQNTCEMLCLTKFEGDLKD